MTDEHKCQSTEQIDKLANFLMKKFQHEFGKAGPEGEGAVEMAIRVMEKQKGLLSDALKAICLTKDYVGPKVELLALPGWEWFDVGKAIAEAIPGDDWAEQFRLRTEE